MNPPAAELRDINCNLDVPFRASPNAAEDESRNLLLYLTDPSTPPRVHSSSVGMGHPGAELRGNLFDYRVSRRSQKIFNKGNNSCSDC